MRKFLLSTAALAALTVSMPASAQAGDLLRQGIESILGGNRGGATDARLNELNTRIQNAYQRGEISQSEASRLQDELGDVAAVAEESSAGAEQVSASTQQTSASTQELTQAAADLARTAGELEELVGGFTLA